MKRVWVVLAVFCCCAVRAQTESIWFLHLRLTNDQVVLVDQKKTPGTLKTPRSSAAARALRVELQAMNGATLWTQTIDDPAMRRVEYEDPAEPGRMRVREVVLTNAEFTVRVPYRQQVRIVVLSRRVAGPAKNLGGESYVEIGRVALKPEENP